jgi:uncharacterized protein YaiI (UPF0178 family)
MTLKILIDADACPRPVKDLVFRASDRLGLPVVLVADRQVGRLRSPLVSTVVVPRDMDSADGRIVEMLEPEDLVITADLPLAAAVVEKGGTALNPRGELYTEENVRERLSVRDFAMSLRETGMDLGGPKPYSGKDKQRFNAAFDRFLSQAARD